jgi:hypothetical protein
MKFMVELTLKPGSKNKVFEAFEQRGPGRIPGVTFHGAWVGTRSDVVFALLESGEESLVAGAAQNWNQHGESKITPVVDVEQF